MTEHCGISRNEAGLQETLKTIPEIREAFWNDLAINGGSAELNQSLEHAGRVADFLEFAELMCIDALTREESCGCHFRKEYQTRDGEALRNDEDFAHVAIWEYTGEGRIPVLYKEPPTRRDYKK